MADIGDLFRGLSQGLRTGFGTYFDLMDREAAAKERERQRGLEAEERTLAAMERARQRSAENERRMREQQVAERYAEARPDLFPTAADALAFVRTGSNVNLLKPEEPDAFDLNTPEGRQAKIDFEARMAEEVAAGRRRGDPPVGRAGNPRAEAEDQLYATLAGGGSPSQLQALRQQMGDPLFFAAVRGIGEMGLASLGGGESGLGLTMQDVIDMSTPPRPPGPDPFEKGPLAGLTGFSLSDVLRTPDVPGAGTVLAPRRPRLPPTPTRGPGIIP